MLKHKRNKKRRGNPYGRIPITWNGKEYKSMSHAARAIGITKEAMRQRINKGYTCDDDLNESAKKVQSENLTEAEIEVIKKYLSSHIQTMSVREIARRFGVDVRKIEKLLNN